MPDPNIIGGSRTVFSAAIVLACILGVGLVMLLGLLSPSGEASADFHVDTGFFLKG